MIRSEKTRQLIIEKTASIFNKKGYTGTYLSDLTKATGLTKGSIYGNFKNKNEVAVEAFKYNYRQLIEKVSRRIQQTERADDKMSVLLNHYKTQYIKIFNNGGCPILNTAIDADDNNELLMKEVIGAIRNWIQKTEDILILGIKKKEFIDIDTTRFTYKIIAIIEGSVLLSKTLKDPKMLLNNIEYLEQEIKKITIN
ncbi:TetR/AcrR family transcriptional regulator [Flavivirga jejuensis]|uniref:TetR/AcrR family transcriptional regulator n=1 Tax=Flavivirga jejuensis TaxID=870487 RepID=A0ABT8WUB4_9FLAO|nr:TetR/AcrR family transcriptional regulator [Flavivirga jejuensis]MDO5976775.1 TetR/AcrR family transcriptional regulator [Flavivirga jejuensis]